VGVSVEVEGGGYGAEQKMKKESVLVFVGGGWRCDAMEKIELHEDRKDADRPELRVFFTT
jgi:hypothetical protein